MKGKRAVAKPEIINILSARDGDKADWYWVRTGEVTVNVSASVAGQTVERTIVAEVEGANNLNFSSETDEVKVGKLEAQDKIPALTFGGVLGQGHGIRWTARFIAPPCPGDVSFTQIMTIHREFTLDNGTFYSISSGDKYVLDEDFSYGVRKQGIEPGDDDEDPETIPCDASELLVLEEADSPSTRLPRSVQRTTSIHKYEGPYKKIGVRETFRLFLMYKPKDGIWISLGVLDWHWAGVAEYEENKWVLKSSDSAVSPKGEARTMLPEWSGNRVDYLLG
jgi:hypothetical protein